MEMGGLVDACDEGKLASLLTGRGDAAGERFGGVSSGGDAG